MTREDDFGRYRGHGPPMSPVPPVSPQGRRRTKRRPRTSSSSSLLSAAARTCGSPANDLWAALVVVAMASAASAWRGRDGLVLLPGRVAVAGFSAPPPSFSSWALRRGPTPPNDDDGRTTIALPRTRRSGGPARRREVFSRRRPELASLGLSMVSRQEAAASSSSTSSSIPVPNQQENHRRGDPRRPDDDDDGETRTQSPFLSAAAASDVDYDAMTVKELRKLVKERATAASAASAAATTSATTERNDPTVVPPPRGLLSRLKKKQDLVQYLRECDYLHATTAAAQEQEPGVEDEMTSLDAPSPAAAAAKKKNTVPTEGVVGPRPRRTATLRRMPPGNWNGPSPGGALPSMSLSMSPKEALIEQLYRRYPRLLQTEDVAARTDIDAFDAFDDERDETNDNDSSAVDVRVDHPMLRAVNVTSSDMDVVFVGTASCTPGTTRGVSCTALRIGGRRVTHPPPLGVGQGGGGAGVTSKKLPQTEPPQNYFQQTTFHGGTWLFDVGECTQLQIQRTPAVKPSRITKIFLTHAHGDHTFGLPGLLCLMGQDKDRTASSTAGTADSSDAAEGPASSRVVDIYGPQGLRKWLRVAIRYSVSRIVPPYRVHELMEVPMAPEWEYNVRTRRFYYSTQNLQQRGRPASSSSSSTPDASTSAWQSPRQLVGQRDAVSWIAQASSISLDPSPLYGEVEGGRDIFPVYHHPLGSDDGAPIYEVEDEGDGELRVFAAPMSHGIPCVGYVIQEADQPGRLRHEHVEPIVRRNVDALTAAGFVAPMKAMAVLKNLAPGTAFTFPDGTVVTSEDAVEPPRPGRKVVICGDTCDSRSLSKLAQGADVIVHEATNTYLSGVDKKQPIARVNGDSGMLSSSSSTSFSQQLRGVTRDAVVHGHSTPFMAGQFAQSVGARRLVLNHFSPRYKGDASLDSLSIMMRIERQAMKASGMNETQVAAAWDLMVLPLPRR